ncbi:MAG: putative cupin superfamily protein, partial [Porticoccaceae bacterium]
RPNTEVATILSGKAIITDANGTERTLVEGSVVTLPKGWTGRWDVVETTRKVYVIVT